MIDQSIKVYGSQVKQKIFVQRKQVLHIVIILIRFIDFNEYFMSNILFKHTTSQNYIFPKKKKKTRTIFDNQSKNIQFITNDVTIKREKEVSRSPSSIGKISKLLGRIP